MLLKLLIKGGKPLKYAEISRPLEDLLTSYKSAAAIVYFYFLLSFCQWNLNEVMQAGAVVLDNCLQLNH